MSVRPEPFPDPVLSESARFFQHSLSLWPFLPQYQHSAMALPWRLSSLRLPLVPEGPELLSASLRCLLPRSRRPPRPPRPRGLSPSVYSILLSACVLVEAPAWFSSTRSIECKLKKDGVFSRVHTAVRNAPNFGAKPQRQIWTMSPPSMFTSMEARESQISLILPLHGSCTHNDVPFTRCIRTALPGSSGG